jgi:hypothetical protein
MSETPVDMGMVSASPSGSATPATAPAQSQQQQQHPAENPRTRGHSPALDHREQQVAPADRKVSVGGVEYPEQSVADALADRAQRQIVQAGLPRDPSGYEIKLPDGFKPPEGLEFQFNVDDPSLKQFRELAHRRGLDQATFSEALGIFAATKMGDLHEVSAAREAQMAKLGATGPQRLDAIETWFNSKIGDKANLMMATLKKYPVATTVEALEQVVRLFSSQGGTSFTQSGREGAEDPGKIAGYDQMSFAQKRAAQMSQQFGGRGGASR